MTTTVTGMAAPPLSVTVAGRINALMVERQVSGYALARSARIPQSSLSRKLRGMAPFDLDDVQAIAGALGVAVAELMADGQG